MTRRTLASLVLVLAACASPARREPATPPSSDEVQEKHALAEVDALYQRAVDARRRGAQEDALSALRAALSVEHLPAKLSSLRGSLHYDIACIELALGRREDALLSLECSTTFLPTDGGAFAQEGSTQQRGEVSLLHGLIAFTE